MIIPSNLNAIQPRSMKVWNCGEIGFDPNGSLNKVICTQKSFQGEEMWKVQTIEVLPFWRMLLVFNRSYGKCFM